MSRLYRGPELLRRFNNFAARTHAAHIIDWLAENGELPRHNVMRSIVQSLCFTYEKFVVNPAMLRELLISQLVIGWNDHMIRASNSAEVLSTPGICFYDWHRYTTRRKRLTFD